MPLKVYDTSYKGNYPVKHTTSSALIILELIFIDNERLLKWSLVAVKRECSGREQGNMFWKARHLKDCAKSCVGVSSMFVYGTNDFGTIRCKGDGCVCFCETEASPDGTCPMNTHNGYRLYRFQSGKP